MASGSDRNEFFFELKDFPLGSCGFPPPLDLVASLDSRRTVSLFDF